ncbi:hypothetical protein EMCRGX_G019099 [Ephydatia muelleri]
MTEDSSVNVDSAYTKVVRYCARPPTKFTTKTDWELWLIRFEAYADEANIGKGDRGKELHAVSARQRTLQRRLCQERRDQIPASALLPVGRGALEDKLDRLTADVQKLTERMAGLSSEPLSTDKSEPKRRTPLRCWHCRQPGHVRRECPALQQQTALNSRGPAGEVYRRL